MTTPSYVVQVGVTNESTVVTDAQVQAVVAALQIQMTYDFFPVWGVKSNIYFLDKSKPVPAGHYQMVVFDTADVANALGYHDLAANGCPLAKIFAKTTMDAGENWTVTCSHEMAEMLADPECNLSVFNQTAQSTGVIIPYEVCDPVQGANCTYKIGSAGNIAVSNFVYPTWFESTPTFSKFDHMGVLTKPFEVYHEGYMSYFQVPNSSGWQQTFAQQAPSGADHSAHRKMLRAKPRKDWKLSVPK